MKITNMVKLHRDFLSNLALQLVCCGHTKQEIDTIRNTLSKYFKKVEGDIYTQVEVDLEKQTAKIIEFSKEASQPYS